jgi:hypothetical protein
MRGADRNAAKKGKGGGAKRGDFLSGDRGGARELCWSLVLWSKRVLIGRRSKKKKKTDKMEENGFEHAAAVALIWR